MIATIATYASPRLNQPTPVQAAPTRAVAPTPPAPVSNDRPPQPAPLRAASIVALAPAAMSALIEAQEHMGDTSVLMRETTADKLDRLISRLDDGDPPPPPADGAPLTVRRLQTAREQLS